MFMYIWCTMNEHVPCTMVLPNIYICLVSHQLFKKLLIYLGVNEVKFLTSHQILIELSYLAYISIFFKKLLKENIHGGKYSQICLLYISNFYKVKIIKKGKNPTNMWLLLTYGTSKRLRCLINTNFYNQLEKCANKKWTNKNTKELFYLL